MVMEFTLLIEQFRRIGRSFEYVKEWNFTGDHPERLLSKALREIKKENLSADKDLIYCGVMDSNIESFGPYRAVSSQWNSIPVEFKHRFRSQFDTAERFWTENNQEQRILEMEW